MYCIFHGDAGYDMKSIKTNKSGICIRRYGKLIKQFAINLTSQVKHFPPSHSAPTPLSVKFMLTQLWQREYACNAMSSQNLIFLRIQLFFFMKHVTNPSPPLKNFI